MKGLAALVAWLLVVAAAATAAAPADRDVVRFQVATTLAASNVAARGTFSASGAIRDAGRVVDQVKNVRGTLQIVRKLRGRKGTLRLRVVTTVKTDGRVRGRWRITAATGDYRGLRGSGTCWGRTSVHRVRHVLAGRIDRA